MKRHLIILLALAVFGTAGITHAAIITPFVNDNSVTDIAPNSSTIDTSAIDNQTAAVAPTPDGPGTAPTAAGTGAGAGVSADQAFGPILAFFMSIFAWLAGTAGVILNDTVYYTVVRMGSVVNPNNLSAIGVAWKVLRDLGNIVLIFGFLAIGISTIVGYDSYGVGRRLPTLLVVAIFINFSLFATQAVVDVGNLFATQFYTQINGGQAPTDQGFSATTFANGGISGTIMDSLALQTLYNVNNGGNNQGLVNGVAALFNMKIALIAILSIILFIVLAFVLFSLSIMLIARFVTLVILMIISPIGFAGLVVPGLEGQSKKWLETLLHQTVTAPVLLLMLYVALAIITDAKFITGFGGAQGSYTAGAAASDPNALTAYAGLLLAFIVAMAFLLACVVLAKNMGAAGASFATKWAGKASFGVAGWGMRNTVGRTSSYLGKGVRNTRFGQTEYGRAVAGVFDKGAKASFDVRATGALNVGGKIDAGKAQKGGYSAEVDAHKKAQLAYSKTLPSTQGQARKDATQGKKDVEENEKQLKKELAELEKRQSIEFDAALDAQIEVKRKEIEEAGKALADAKATLEKTPKSAQDAYARSLDSGLTKGLARTTGVAGGAVGGGVGGFATGAGTGAAIGMFAGPAGAAVGAAVGAAIGATAGIAGGTIAGWRIAPKSSASAQASRDILKSVNGSKMDNALANLKEAVGEASKEGKEKEESGEGKKEGDKDHK